jgi:hypothetical protein
MYHPLLLPRLLLLNANSWSHRSDCLSTLATAAGQQKNHPKIINLPLQNSRIYCIFSGKYAKKAVFMEH